MLSASLNKNISFLHQLYDWHGDWFPTNDSPSSQPQISNPVKPIKPIWAPLNKQQKQQTKQTTIYLFLNDNGHNTGLQKGQRNLKELDPIYTGYINKNPVLSGECPVLVLKQLSNQYIRHVCAALNT